MVSLCSGVMEFWRFRGSEFQSFGGTEKWRNGENGETRANQFLSEVSNGVEVHTMKDGQSRGLGLGVP